MKRLPPQDITGREFKVGDRIAYPLRRSSSLWMEQGTIVEIKDDCLVLAPVARTGHRRSDRHSHLSRSDRAVIIDRDAGFWKSQAMASFEEVDMLAVEINRVYRLLGYEKKFVTNIHPAHHELAAIVADLEKGKLP